MKRIHVIGALLAFQCLAFSNEAGRNADIATQFEPVAHEDLPFKPGEKLSYDIRYGLVKAGEAQLEVKTLTNRRNKAVYHMVGTGRTTGMTDWFFPTRDRYETFLDTSTLHPVEFIRDVDEGGYEIKRHIVFDQSRKTARDLIGIDSTFQFDRNMQDIFSAFYYARSLNTKDIRPGDEITIDVFMDYEHFPFKLKFAGRENVELDDFTINCMKFIPIVQEGRVFKEKESMIIWVSNDANHIPIRLKSELAVGSIKVDLTSYRNLSHPLNRVR